MSKKLHFFICFFSLFYLIVLFETYNQFWELRITALKIALSLFLGFWTLPRIARISLIANSRQNCGFYIDVGRRFIQLEQLWLKFIPVGLCKQKWTEGNYYIRSLILLDIIQVCENLALIECIIWFHYVYVVLEYLCLNLCNESFFSKHMTHFKKVAQLKGNELFWFGRFFLQLLSHDFTWSAHTCKHLSRISNSQTTFGGESGLLGDRSAHTYLFGSLIKSNGSL